MFSYPICRTDSLLLYSMLPLSSKGLLNFYKQFVMTVALHSIN